MLQGFFFPSMALFLGLGALLVLWLGSREVIRGRITVGEFVAFNRLSDDAQLADDRVRLGDEHAAARHGVVEADARGARRGRRRSATPSVTRRGSLGRPLTGAHRISRPRVHLPGDDRPVLNHVSRGSRPGRPSRSSASTGSGKSTLISLLARLHDPPPGTVFIDGVDVRDIPLATLRGAIGFVPQEPFLFSDTLADNVAFGLDAQGARRRAGSGRSGRTGRRASDGRSTGTRERRRELDADARRRRRGSTRTSPTFPNGYETMVGERGITLSGGQKQRTALARAMVIDPRILILDDALSAVDTYTEEEILSRLRGVMRQRTSIIVSHRISTVRDADQIFVLDEGRIAERGTPRRAGRARRALRRAAQAAAAGRGAGGKLDSVSSCSISRQHSVESRFSARRLATAI